MKRAARILSVTLALAAISAIGQENPPTPPQRENSGGGRGDRRGWWNASPEERQKMMMDSIKERLEISDEDEWKAVSGLLTKTYDAQRAVRSATGSIFELMRPGGDRGPRSGGMFGTPSPELEALQKAVEAKASASELKDKLATLREVRKAKEAELTKAQEELRKVLSVRQEAVAVQLGLLP